MDDKRSMNSGSTFQTGTRKYQNDVTTEPRVGEAAQELYEESKKMANQLYEDSRNKVQEAQSSIKMYSNDIANKVQQQPLLSLLIAGGVGFILSSLFRR